MKLAVLGRCTVEKPISARVVPDEDRWKMGCAGLLGLSDMRDPETVRTCVVVCGACRFDCEVERFMAEAGIGIADTL
jgi:hypothetical protein